MASDASSLLRPCVRPFKGEVGQAEGKQTREEGQGRETQQWLIFRVENPRALWEQWLAACVICWLLPGRKRQAVSGAVSVCPSRKMMQYAQPCLLASVCCQDIRVTAATFPTTPRPWEFKAMMVGRRNGQVHITVFSGDRTSAWA